MQSVRSCPRQGDVFWCNVTGFGERIEKFRRPYVVVSCEQCNNSSPNVTIVPCTTKQKKWLPSHAKITVYGESTAMAELVVTVTKSWLGEYICHLSQEEFEGVHNALMNHLENTWKCE